MAANENFNLNLQNEEEEFVVDFGETTNLGGGGGTTNNFNELTNRPKYDNITMTGGTNIPKVPAKTSELTNDANFATKTEVGTAVEAESLARESADTAINGAIANETTARQNADNGLQSQIDAIVASSDVKDIVGNYAELQAYDTSTLGNNDIIKVLQDETHSNETTYYRWSTATSSFSLIGEEGPYYTKAQTDTLLNGKQNILTAGNNIQISGDTISATDTTYTAGNNVDITNNVISATDTTYADFTGTDGSSAGSAGLVPAPATTDAGKFLKADGTWDTAGGGSSVIELTSADYNYPDNNPDGVALWKLDGGLYTTVDSSTKLYVNNITVSTPAVGTTWLLVKNPASNNHSVSIIEQGNGTDVPHAYVTNINNGNSFINDKSLGGPTVEQTTGTSTLRVMSQNAVTSMIYADPSTKYKIQLGVNGVVTGNAAMGIGYAANATGDNAIAIGNNSATAHKGGISLGVGAITNAQGEMNIGAGSLTNFGYNNSAYRLLSGLYDGQSAHDAVTVEQVNATIDAINTALSTNIPHIGASS